MAVLGYHLVLAAYGFWLPNDPRGSGSPFVGSQALYDEAGPATFLADRQRSVAGALHDQDARRRAKRALNAPPVRWNGEQARLIVHAMAAYLERDGIPIWAAAILTDHLHLVIARSEKRIEHLANWLKGAATRSLRDHGALPIRDTKMFARGYWATYLDSVEAIAAAIRYVEQNPIKDGLKSQHWSFVQPFTGD